MIWPTYFYTTDNVYSYILDLNLTIIHKTLKNMPMKCTEKQNYTAYNIYYRVLSDVVITQYWFIEYTFKLNDDASKNYCDHQKNLFNREILLLPFS